MVVKYEFETQPWEHQLTALRLAWKRPGFAYLMEMGVGKSKVAIDEAGMLYENGLVSGWVIMAPKGVYRNWTRPGGELDTHLPARIRERARVVVWEAGGGSKENQRALERALRPHDGLTVLVMNTEAVQTPGKARVYLAAFLRAHVCKWDLDEATFIKNPSAARTKFILETAPLAAYRRIMTGSPVTRSPLDVYSLFEFIKPGCLGHRNFYSFRARYAIVKTTNFTPRALRDQGKRHRDVKVVVGYRNLEELSARIRDHSYRVTKEECLDLPPKIYTRRDVDLTLEQIKIYDEIRDEALAMLSDEEFVSTDNVLGQLLRLQQIVCGFVKDDDGTEHVIPSNRVDQCLEAVDEVDGKVIIWSRFRRNIADLATALGERYGPDSVAQYHGGNVKTRQEDVDRFLNDDACRFMLSNQQAGGYGNTWIVANTVVYFSNDFDLERRMQSEDRAHRGGQTQKVTYVDLVASGTVDEKIVTALRKKIDIASTVLQESPREWLK